MGYMDKTQEEKNKERFNKEDILKFSSLKDSFVFSDNWDRIRR
jgi:hypothetical protein